MELSFNKANLVERCRINAIADNCQVVPVSYLRDRNNGKDLEDKVIHIRILSCTAGSSTSQFQRTQYSSYSSNKKLNTMISTYNRFFLVADIANPPWCAVIITRSAAETHAMLRHLGADTFIGTDFYVHEADLSTSVIKDTRTQILEVPDTGILPLISPGCVPFRSTKNYMTKPALGDTYYFVLTEEEIEMRRIKHIRNASCTGVQCDRQKGREGCSCLHNTNSQSSVYAFDVFFSVPTTLETGGQAMVFGFRSLRTTRLFFTDYEAHANTTTDEEEEACRITNRNKISAMVEFINRHGGWNIVGWYKMGGATDSATSNTDKVENYEVTIHLSYLFPAKYDASIRQNVQFQTMQIGYIARPAITGTRE